MFVGEPFSASLLSDIEKFYAYEGSITIFCQKFFVTQCRKNSSGSPSMLCFRKFPLAKKFMDKRGGGGYQGFPSKIYLSHSAENFRRGTLYCFIDLGFGKMLRISGKKCWQGSVSNSEPTAWEPCCPKPTAFICFWMKRVASLGLKKKKNDPTERIIFPVNFIYGEK